MIKKFCVKNFKNFNEELVLDFSKVRDYEFNQNLIKNNLINKMLVVGKNNSGKSNLGAAIMDITRHLTDNKISPELYLYYQNGSSVDTEVSFKYEFLFNNQVITYSYQKDEYANLLLEELKDDNKVLFKYNYKTNKFVNNIEEAKTIDLKKKNQDMSALKYIYNNTLYWSEDSPVKMLMEFVNGMLWFRSLRHNDYMGFMSGTDDLDDFIIQNDLIKDFEKFLNDCGQDYKLSTMIESGREVIAVKYDNYKARFSKVASTGTISLWLFYYWMNKTDKISFAFIDEFDAFYHYELSKYILEYVNHKDGFQSILTSHNTYLINNEIMRPDCYMYLKDGSITSFAYLTNKNIRQAHNLEKMLFGGEFEE